MDFEKDMDIVGEAENGEKVLDILRIRDQM